MNVARERRPTVLVVDDDADHALMLEMSLQNLGYEALSAHSCMGARAVLAASAVDALVTDLTLGDGTALDLVTSLGETRPTVTILLTGYDDPVHLDLGRRLQVDAYLVKPTSTTTIAAVIRKGLTRARSRRIPTPCSYLGEVERDDLRLARTRVDRPSERLITAVESEPQVG